MAIETNNWPSWLLEMWPNWLQNINYPRAGVGDLTDLKLALGVGQDGRWLGFIHPGWYYHNNVEQYKYVQVGSVQVANYYGVSGLLTTTTSFRPAWGPIQVHGVTDDASGRNDGPYREHHNSFIPCTTLTWSINSSSTIRATIPASAILVGMRDQSNLPLGAVAGISRITNEKQYYYDTASGYVYIKPTVATNLTPTVWADILYTYPKLRFREIVISEIDASGYAIVNPSYQRIQEVHAYRGSSFTVLVSGFHASGSIRHSLANTYAGDWVALDYWIAKSFVVETHRRIWYFVGGPLSSAYTDTFKVYYETSIPDILPNILVNTPSSAIFNVFNVNPLFQYGYRSGYLFHGHPASGINSYWDPAKLKMYLDKDVICNSWAEHVKVKITVTEDNDLPVPYYTLNITVSGGSAVLKLPDNMTNGRGETHYLIKPDAAGVSVITIKASCGTLFASASVSVVASASLIDGTKWYDGFVNIVVTNDKTSRGAFRSFVTASMADGLPRDHITYLTSKLASEFHTGSERTLTQRATVDSSVSVPNIQALAEFGYVPQPGDSLFGYSRVAISKIIKGEA